MDIRLTNPLCKRTNKYWRGRVLSLFRDFKKRGLGVSTIYSPHRLKEGYENKYYFFDCQKALSVVRSRYKCKCNKYYYGPNNSYVVNHESNVKWELHNRLQRKKHKLYGF